MITEQENKWREEFESTFANKDVLIMDSGGNYYHHEVQDNFNTYLEARKKAQEEFNKFLEGEFFGEYTLRNIPGHVLFHSPLGYIHGLYKKRQWKQLRDLAQRAIHGFFYNAGYEECEKEKNNEITQLKEELKSERFFSSKFELQAMRGFPTDKEWHYLVKEHLKTQKQRKVKL